MEKKEKVWCLFSFPVENLVANVSFRVYYKKNRLDSRRWPTFANNCPRKFEWANSRKGIDLFLRAEHEKLNRVSHRDCNVPLFPSIKAFKMVETLVERISRCVNGALILRKRLRAQIFHLRYAPLSNLSYYLQFPYLSFLPLPVSISRNKKYLVESDNAEWQFLESRAEFLISAAIHDNNNAL